MTKASSSVLDTPDTAVESEAMGVIHVKLTGISPLLLHNCRRFLDPNDSEAKKFRKLGQKRGKTEDDLSRLSDMEFVLGCYCDDQGRPIIPSENLEAMIVAGAKKSKKGQQAIAGVICSDARISYTGPSTVDKLGENPKFRDVRPVIISRSRVLRTRPRFDEWSVSFQVEFIKEVIDRQDVTDALEKAGLVCGLGDYRPKYGRFIVQID